MLDRVPVANGGAGACGGVDVDARPVAARREIGYLPEQVSLYPELTVRRYLRFVAGMKGIDGAAARAAVDQGLARCALEGVADRRTGVLSKGYRQRVGLAQALVHDPDLLILDEPTSGLDPNQIVEIRGLIKELGREKTIILSTHILSEAAALCTRIVILSRGHLVAEDTPAGLATRLKGVERVVVRVDGPADEVAAMLGGFPGVLGVEREDGRLVVRAAPGGAHPACGRGGRRGPRLDAAGARNRGAEPRGPVRPRRPLSRACERS